LRDEGKTKGERRMEKGESEEEDLRLET